jgi:hypothetical protein
VTRTGRRIVVAWFFLTWGVGAGDVRAVGPFRTQARCEAARAQWVARYPGASTTGCADGDQVMP